MEGNDVFSKNKPHRARQSGKKAEKKKNKEKPNLDNVDPKLRNPKAYAIQNVVRAERRFRRTQDIETKKERIPTVDRTPVEPPPFIIAIVGPPKVGKSTLFRNLIKNFTRQTLTEIKGPVTIVSGKKRRLTIMECNNDLNSMIDVAKIADLVLLLIDASFGFEMEVFEFLNICQVHGFPQIMGVLTHLDTFKNKTHLKKTKKTLKHRFWTEVYPGSKLFYLSGYYPNTDAYPKNEIHNLSRFVSVMKFRPTQWRSDHSHVLVDRLEDLTSLEAIRVNAKVDRTVCLYGFVHGTFLKSHVSVHIPGLGDYTPRQITSLPDPCPLPMKERNFKRSLNEKEKVMYAPFCGVGGIVYDQDAVYIDLGGSHSHRKVEDVGEKKETSETPFVEELRELSTTLDAKIESAGLKLFSNSKEIKLADVDPDAGNGSEEDGEEMDLEEDADDKIDSPQQEEEEESPIKQRNYEVVQSEDGRMRRKVVFEDKARVLDDVTEEIQAELDNLKASMNGGEDAGIENSDDESGENDSEDEGASDEDDPEIANGRSDSKSLHNMSKANEPASDDDDSVSKEKSKSSCKSKISKSNGGGAPPKRSVESQEQSIYNAHQDDYAFDESMSEDDDQGDQNHFEDDVNEEEASQEDGNEDDTKEPEVSDEEANEDEENDSEEESEESFQIQPDNLTSEKEARIAKAESAFYSRFRTRSLQKMIYDPTEDYLSVTSRADFDNANVAVRDAQDLGSAEKLKNLFVGGDYAETAKEILDADDDDGDDDDIFDDFDELDEENPGKSEKEKPKNEAERQDLKKKLKEKFDMEYDGGKDDKSFYREWKSTMEEQAKSNRQFFEEIEDPKLLEDLRGFAPGTYVRVEIDGIPCEFITKFEPQARCPLVVGSLDSANQETLAVIQARVKKHRWHPKILKSKDPLIMSVGWRRFQTIALYSVHDHNMRNRMIKYTPEHLHCIANFYGPMTPQGTGILGIAPSGFGGFRITLTGTILDMDKSAELVKKLKLVGSPAKVFKKSAFIQGMFNSRLEVAKFVGAKIKTVSGIRGVIKRPLQAPPGGLRATFEDKILMSDIVFCRTWVTVEIPRFFLNIANHVDEKPRLVKTLGELKREKGIQIEANSDNLYSAIERKERVFRPLKIPRSLQEKLPYKEKPKVQAKENAPKRIAVIKEPHERKMSKFLNVLKSRLSEKEQREKLEKSKKQSERAKRLQKDEEKMTRRQKELKKKVFKTLEKINKRKERGNASGGNRDRPKGQFRGKFGRK